MDWRPVLVNSKEGKKWIAYDEILRNLVRNNQPNPTSCHGECGARQIHKIRHKGCAYAPSIGKKD